MTKSDKTNLKMDRVLDKHRLFWLNAIEISLDREAVVWDPAKIIEYCKKIQSANKSVLIHGQLSQGELNELSASLSPAGLAIFHWE